jgi:hypothetical protein
VNGPQSITRALKLNLSLKILKHLAEILRISEKDAMSAPGPAIVVSTTAALATKLQGRDKDDNEDVYYYPDIYFLGDPDSNFAAWLY